MIELPCLCGLSYHGEELDGRRRQLRMPLAPQPRYYPGWSPIRTATNARPEHGK